MVADLVDIDYPSRPNSLEAFGRALVAIVEAGGHSAEDIDRDIVVRYWVNHLKGENEEIRKKFKGLRGISIHTIHLRTLMPVR